MLIDRFRLALAGLLWSGLAYSATQAELPVITLPMALQFAMEHSPEIAMARQEVMVQDGKVVQARLPENPEIGLEVENLDAKGAMKEETRSITLGLSQTVDLSRFSRASIAARERDLARLDLESVRYRTRIQIRQRFIAVVAAQGRRALSDEIGQGIRSAHGLAVEKVRAGKVAPMDSLQSFVALSLAGIDSGKAAEALTLARRELSSACGYGKADFDSAQGTLDAMVAPPEWSEIESKLNANADWVRAEWEARLSDAELSAEKSTRIPPLTVAAGIRQAPDRRGRAFVAGVTLPLPIWNWNQGSIRSAQARKVQVGEEGKARRIHLVDRLAEVHGRAVSSYREAKLLSGAILPAAKATFDGAMEGYRVGKFGSLETLTAQNGLFEAQAHYLDALTEYQLAMAELEETTTTISGVQP